MLVSLLLTSFLPAGLLFRKMGGGRREAALSAAVIWGGLLALGTELLSAVTLLTFAGVAGFWSLVSIVLWCAWAMTPRKSSLFGSPPGPALSARNPLAISVACLALMVLLVACLAPPNNWDSMTYHMSRVAHWIQNRSVAHYPSHITRQLTFNPWAEFAILHAQVLSRTDWFANLVQWFSMAGSVLGVSLIAREFGVGADGQCLAGVLAATLPVGILEASSTQNDYVVAFWLVCFVYFGLVTLSQGLTWSRTLPAGGALGLAILTKSTACIFAFPFALWFSLAWLRRGRGPAWKHGLGVAALVLLLNLPHILRNLEVFHAPFGEQGEYLSDGFGPPFLLYNVVRSLASHLVVPGLWLGPVLHKGVQLVHRVLRLAAGATGATFPQPYFHITNHPLHEDAAGNAAHLVLVFVCALAVVSRPDLRSWKGPTRYFILLTASFLLFCASLRWLPWQTRLHLPLFVLFAPFGAWVLDRWGGPKVLRSAAILFLAASLPWALRNETRPLLGPGSVLSVSRLQQYFVSRDDLLDLYTGAARFVKSQGCREIGLILDEDSWEYPLWILLDAVQIDHVNVTNASRGRSNRDRLPCAVISVDREAIEPQGYRRAWVEGPVSVFARTQFTGVP